MTSNIDLQFIALAQQMADSTGDILRHYYRKPFTVDQKNDASPVTIADREVEQKLREMIETHYPDHGIIGEEFGTIRPESPYQWVLDPIDGTRSFIAGYPLFTTLIALAHNTVPVLGVINQPISGERWVGVAGEVTQARANHKTLAQAVIATTSTDYFTPEQAQPFQKLKKQCANTILGGDAYAYAMLASGHIDIVVDAGMKPYDFCALKPIIEGMGGVITDWNGEAITIHSDGSTIAAASEELHRQAFKIISS